MATNQGNCSSDQASSPAETPGRQAEEEDLDSIWGKAGNPTGSPKEEESAKTSGNNYESEGRKDRLTMKNLDRGFQLAKELVDLFFAEDPHMERSLRFKKEIEGAMAPYREVYRDLYNRQKQTPGCSGSSPSPSSPLHQRKPTLDHNQSSQSNNKKGLGRPRLDFQANLQDGGDPMAETRRQMRRQFQSGQGLAVGFPQPGGTGFSSFSVPAIPEGFSASRHRVSHGRMRPAHDVMSDTNARDRMRMCQSMHSTGQLRLSGQDGESFDFTAEDLKDLGEIGRGAFGAVNKMIHRRTNTVMAVKRIRSTMDEKDQKKLLMDLEVVMKCNDCSCIVQFYGALFKEGDCWICMEIMDTSLDKFYKFIYENLNRRIPEAIIAKITVATVTALNYLKERLEIIHRDVKPSNILLDRRGNIKLCDFGISGKLVDSIARTRDAGCRPYMAPERIDPLLAKGYDVRSDVWSLGITLMEVATGRFPYPHWASVFEQLTQVVQGDPPRLSQRDNGNSFSENFVDFVNTCLIKEENKRPKYKALLEYPFIQSGTMTRSEVATYVAEVLDKMEAAEA